MDIATFAVGSTGTSLVDVDIEGKSVIPSLRGPGPVFIKLAEIKISLKPQVLVSNLRPFLVSEWVGIHEILETKFGLRIGLKVKTGT